MDIDGDNVSNSQDDNPMDPTRCRDADGDTCDGMAIAFAWIPCTHVLIICCSSDCASGTDDPMSDGLDSDGDGNCTLCMSWVHAHADVLCNRAV